MPPLDRLNPPPNPFWEFVAEMQDHPMIAAYGPSARSRSFREGEATTTQGSAATTNSNNQQQEKQPEEKVDDPPEVDPTTVQPQGRERPNIPFRGRHCGESDASGDEHQRRRRCHGRRGWGARPEGPFNQPGFPFAGVGGGPFWLRGRHPHHHQHHPPPPPPFEQFGPGAGAHTHAGPHGRGGFHHRGGPMHGQHGPHGPHGHHGRHGFRGASPPGRNNFDIGQFLGDLGNKIGMDLSGAAQSLGLDRFMPTAASGPDVDFEPRVDIFDRRADYVVHVSLPGAKKSDLGVDWDGEHSALRVSGVVHRPEVDEAMLSQLVVDGRKRETGVFEKLIRLGTRGDPANVDVNSIRARMTGGVLIVTVPKLEKYDTRREVPIAQSQTPSPVRDVEQQAFADAYYQNYNIYNNYNTEQQPNTDLLTGGDSTPIGSGEIQMIDRDETEAAEKGKRPEHAYEKMSQHSRESTGTIQAGDHADVDAEPEQLPAYHPTPQQQQQDHGRVVPDHDAEDWENFGSDEEGEYVKINVD